MTKLQEQQSAIAMAVRAALHKIGRETVKSQEFFGTNQNRFEDIKLAA